MHAQDLCSKKTSSPSQKENRDDAFCGEFQNSQWVGCDEKGVFHNHAVCVILHWPMNQHAMRSSANDVNYHKRKQELRNRWVQNWNWEEGAQTALRSQAQAMNIHWFLYRTHKWWKSWGNQREKLSEINPIKSNMVDAFMILCYSLKHKSGE